MTYHPIHRIAKSLLAGLTASLAATASLPAQQAGDSPVKIFILAGQSNM